MKSILLTLCCAMVVTVTFGQLPASYLNKKPIPFVNVPSKPAVSGAQRGISTFEVSYHDMEFNYSDANGFDFGYLPWDLNKNFDVSCNPLDTLDDNTISWAAVVFDSIHDYINDISYQKSTFNSMTVDTIFWLYNHQNVSGLNDTLIVSIYAMAASPSGITLTASQKEFTNTLLWSDTTIADSSFTPTGGSDLYFGFVATGGITVPAGQGFVVRLDYAGPKQDVFTLADGNRLECGNAGAASESIVPGNTFRYYNGGNYTPAPCSDLSGTGSLVFPSLPAECNQFYFQNFAISAVVTVDAPLAVSATASTNLGCPGEFVTLSANASGGSGPNNYSYTWTGAGNFTSPNSPATNVALPTGNQIQTYTITVIDAVEMDTATATVNVNVRGISVNLGNDTTINCTDSVAVTAATSGYLNGSTFAWSTGANTQTANLRGGTHTVTVTNNSGCSATDTKVISLNVNQNLSFVATTYYNGSSQDTNLISLNRVCPDVTVLFENTSTNTTDWNFLWDYDNGLQSINPDGATTFPSGGTQTSYSVTLTADDGAGCVITSEPYVIQVVAPSFPRCTAVGMEEVVLLSNINLYPNPNTGTFTVDLTKVNAEDANIVVLDMLGKVVYNSNTFSTSATPVQAIELNNAAGGLYFVRITANGVTATSKISVAK